MSTPTKPPAGPAAHYPSGILGSAHPGTVEDCPNLLCVQARETAGAPDSTLRGRIAAALLARIRQATVQPGTPLFGGGMQHVMAADEYDLADVVLPIVATERAAAYRDAATVADEAGATYAQRGDHDQAGVAFAVMEQLAAKAAGCSWPPCNSEETCAQHAHADVTGEQA